MPANRIFIGVPVPWETALQIQSLLPDYAFLNRVSPENYHITLLFLGHVPDLQNIMDKFETITFKSFKVLISGISGFFKKDKLHVIYLTVFDSDDRLGTLNQEAKSLFPEYVDEQFPTYVPHLTLCRNIKSNEVSQAQTLLGLKFAQPIEFEALQINLYDSSNFKFLRLYRRVASVGAEL